jgi:hypothetical protein
MKFDLLAQLNNKIPKRTKICFISGIIIGWLTHFYMFSHKLVNWDDINSFNSFGSGDYLGRWFLKYIHPLGSIYSIPAVHGLLFVLLLTLSACCILEIMQIKSVTGAVLVPALMITFPSVASTMAFMFMAHTSGMGIFMASLGVYLLRKYRFGWLPCGVLLICTLGTYQSYISFAITLMLMGMISDSINGKKFPEMLKKGIICVAVLGVSVLLYMKLSHWIYPNIDNETYGGIGNMGQIAIGEMPRLIGRCYKRFLEYFIWKPFAFVSKFSQTTNIITCILAVLLFLLLTVQRKLYKDLLSFLLLIVYCLFVPLAAAFVYFMAPEADYSMLMLYAYVLVFVIVVALLEYCVQDWEQAADLSLLRRVAAQAVAVITAATIFFSSYSDYLLTNRAYLRTDIATERVKAYFNRVLCMAESTEGFQQNDKVAILGEFYYKNNPSSVEIDILESEDLRELSGIALENGLITSSVRENFIKTFLGYELAKLDWAEKEALMETEQYKRMPLYPENGCVQKINDIWVVKMCE